MLDIQGNKNVKKVKKIVDKSGDVVKFIATEGG
jgi:hypothetical protein